VNSRFFDVASREGFSPQIAARGFGALATPCLARIGCEPSEECLAPGETQYFTG
jgi:hypothetical protein